MLIRFHPLRVRFFFIIRENGMENENENANFQYVFVLSQGNKTRTENIKALLVFVYVINDK